MAHRRDVQRNTAFFLGAFGTALGVLGGVMSALGIMAWLLPDFAQTAPDWFFALVVVGLLILIVGAWPALDWLVNSRPSIGGPVLAILGVLLVGIGVVAALWTPWGLTGWLAVAGGIILLPASYLALVGGGTEPLTWHSLRTERVRAVEARLNPVVALIFAAVVIISLGLMVIAALDGRDWLTLAALGVVGLIVAGWLLLKHRRR